MGIYDRDYYRDDGGGWWAGMTGRQASVGLMLATGGVFLLQMLTTPARGGGLDPVTAFGAYLYPNVTDGEVWRLVTAMFVHPPRTLWPVAMTLLLLYWVGTTLESVYGTREFLAFYLTAGVTATTGQFLLAAGGVAVPPAATTAGGATTAALVLYACHFPYNTVLLFFVIPVPVWLLVSGVVGLQLLGALAGAGPSVTLIGAGFGLLYFNRQFRISTVWDAVTAPFSRSRRNRTRLKVYRGPTEPEPVAAAPTRPAARAAAEAPQPRPVDEHLEAKLDAVLEKVSRFGKDSLSAEERQLLLRASEIYKRRRES